MDKHHDRRKAGRRVRDLHTGGTQAEGKKIEKALREFADLRRATPEGVEVEHCAIYCTTIRGRIQE